MSFPPKILRSPIARAILLIVAGATLGLASNLLRASGLRFSSFAAPTMCDGVEAETTAPPIAPEAAATLCGREGIVIADARPAAAYAEGHIASAVHLPCNASGAFADGTIAHFEGARTIIVYGQSTAEAVPVAASLRRRQKATLPVDVRVLEGGFPAWEKAGLACASGPCDECRDTPRSP